MKKTPDVTRWAGEHPPTRGQILDQFIGEDLAPYQWSNQPGYIYGAHEHPYHKVIYVVEGSITFGLPDRDEAIRLEAGDRLDLPPGIRHDATVGPEGVVCLEAQRY